MTVFNALLRKHLLESRWMIGVSTAAFLALGVLTSWLTHRFEHFIEIGEPSSSARRFGFLRALGGPEMDYSTTALLVCWWNHPVIILTVLCWVISRAAAAVAGEIERGTIDVTLSRPVSRREYLSSQIVFAALGLMVMVAALASGSFIGRWIWTLKAAPGVLTMLKPWTMLVTLGMAVFGYSLPFSTIDVVKWRPTLAAVVITLGGLIAMSLAPQFDGYDWLESLSVFRAYAPVTVAMKGEPLAYNATVLMLVFAVGAGASLWLFSGRDLPSNS